MAEVGDDGGLHVRVIGKRCVVSGFKPYVPFALAGGGSDKAQPASLAAGVLSGAAPSC